MSDDQNTEQTTLAAERGLVHIALSKLAVSPQNIRRTDRKVDIDALAASIKSLGLLQNLSVTRGQGDRFTVVAGGRRLAALKALAKQGFLARDYAVPCHILDEEAGLESSLAENVHRVAADAMDEVEAFAALQHQGLDAQAIAQRFGCTIRHVDQRLALAALSPKLKAAYRKGALSLDAARAFCIEHDPSRQEGVFKMLRKPVTDAGNVRAHLTHGRMRGTDKLARFVGLDAYEAAGGSLTRDLFVESETYVDDPALLTRMSNAKLEAFREDLLAKGWGWVNVNLGHGRFEGAGAQRIQPSRRLPTEEEAAALAQLEAAIEELESILENADQDDPQWAERDRLDAEHQSLSERLVCWDPEEMALAGVVLSVEYDGRLYFAHGVVAKADNGKLAKLRRQRDDATAKRLRAQAAPTTPTGPDADKGGIAHADISEDDVEAPWEEPRATLPRALVRDLTAVRTAALRHELVKAPQTALAIGVFALLRHAMSGHGAPGVSLSTRRQWIAERDGLGDGWEGLIAILPDTEIGLLDWCLAQDSAALLAALALLVASSIDFAHEDASIDDRCKQVLADRIAVALNLDMRRHWAPDTKFWTRLPKAALIAALEGAPCKMRMANDARASFLRKSAKATREDLAKTVAQALDGTGWLPALFEAPDAEPQFELTELGRQALEQ